jgi:hypothetical protein
VSTEDLSCTVVPNGLWGPEEALRETVVLEESCGIGNGEVPGRVSTVDESVDD